MKALPEGTGVVAYQIRPGRIPIRDASLYVDVVGHGYPLLLMHGGPGADHWTLLPFRQLADQFTLIFYDHRCNGRSFGGHVALEYALRYPGSLSHLVLVDNGGDSRWSRHNAVRATTRTRGSPPRSWRPSGTSSPHRRRRTATVLTADLP